MIWWGESGFSWATFLMGRDCGWEGIWNADGYFRHEERALMSEIFALEM